MRAIFNDLGYSLPIPINRLEHESEETKQLFTYHLRPQDWIQHWMDSNPEILAGKGNPQENFKCFWEVYRQKHPSHEVYQKHSNNLGMVVPILLHGDEGRAVKRTNYFVTSIESPLGSVLDPNLKCSCHEKLLQRPNIPSYGCDSRVLDEQTLKVARAMVTNFKGHSYLSRFLLFGVGGWIYKRHPAVIDKLLLEVSMNLRELFETGVELSGPAGATIFAAMVSIKGDMDSHKKVMNLIIAWRVVKHTPSKTTEKRHHGLALATNPVLGCPNHTLPSSHLTPRHLRWHFKVTWCTFSNWG